MAYVMVKGKENSWVSWSKDEVKLLKRLFHNEINLTFHKHLSAYIRVQLCQNKGL
jgi:hypothetical protein